MKSLATGRRRQSHGNWMH